jgi:two-component system sensor histidine kinase KdpD
MSGLIATVPGADHTANVSMLYLLVVIGAALWLGRGAAVLAALLAVVSFDWFFVKPYHTLNVSNPAEWLALAVFLVTALVISQLTTLLRQQAAIEAQAQALAEGDRLKTALLSMVSHDFRSPLAAIKASVTSLLQGDSPWDVQTQRELLCGIDVETDRLNHMVGNILTLSRLEAGEWQPNKDVVAVAELVGAALDRFNPEENQRIKVSMGAEVTEAVLDGVQIVQVLQNLLENALKYSPPASPVEICITQCAGVLCIQVLDRGFSLPPGEEDQIFERFYRAKRWRESAQPGTGIGLAICRGLIEAHGGRLTAKNREDGGSIFTIELPLTP